MNNFTLTFHSEQLEQKYQNSREPTRRVIFLGILSLILINNILKLILDAIYEINTAWYIQLSIAIVASVAMILYQQLKPCMHYCLILMNYCCLAEYVQLDSTYSLHQAYAKGMNIMVIHIMILIGTEFKDCLHQIVLITLTRIVLSFMLNQQFAIPQYFLCLSLIIAQIIAFYCFNKALRRQFLLRLRENQLELFIPIVIKQPFYYFEYKNYQFQLIKTNSNQQHSSQIDLYMDYCDGCRFRQMLRNYKIQNLSFEKFILSRIDKNNSQQYSQYEIEIQTNYKTKQIIQFSELFTEKTQFLIVFNSHVTELDSYIQIKEYYNKFQQFMINHISNTYKILKLPKHKIVKNLIRLNLSCTSGFVFQQQTMKYFDALKVLRTLKNIVNSNVYLLAKQSEIVINTYKVLFIVAFYQIMEILNQFNEKIQKKITLILMSDEQSNQNYLQISISLSQPNNFIQRYKENSILKRMETTLFQDIKMEQNIVITILDLGYSVPFQKPYQSNKLIMYENEEEQVSLMT